MKITEKAQEILNRIVETFQSGVIPEAIAMTIIPPLDIPCAHWSLNNRIITFLFGTSDARGIRQWDEVGRYPKKGSKAIHILVPLIRKKTVEKDEEETERSLLYGFRAMPVFRVEDTDGEPLTYPDIEPATPPPLIDVAERWGIAVKYQGFLGGYYGAYAPARREIRLATHDEMTFFHELAHVAHEKVLGKLKLGQDWKQEIVAELSAAAMLHMYGRRPNDGMAYQYIERYAQEADKDVHRACLSVIAETERCLTLILSETTEGANKAAS